VSVQKRFDVTLDSNCESDQRISLLDALEDEPVVVVYCVLSAIRNAVLRVDLCRRHLSDLKVDQDFGHALVDLSG
jgi:hypothetical protein